MEAGSWDLPGHLQQLPSVAGIELSEWPEPVFLECFAGKAVLTTAALSLSIPCAQPWDVLYAAECNVLTHGHELFQAVKGGRVRHMHFGMPRQSMAWDRKPALRSTEWPLGLPGLTSKQDALVRAGNDLASFTAALCIQLWSVGATFSVENPELSWLWLLPCFRKVRDLPGVHFVRVRFSDYMVPFTKPVLILHNVPNWHSAASVTFPWRGPLISRKGRVKDGRRWVFRTMLFQTYPPLLCLRLAELLKGCWDMPAGAERSESFCLPPALCNAQVAVWDVPQVLRFVVPHGLGAPCGLSHMQHVAFALKAVHPAAVPIVFEPDLEEAVKFECLSSVEEIQEFREQQLKQIMYFAVQLEHERSLWVQGAPPALHDLVRRIHGPLLRCLANMAGIEADDFVNDLQQGFPLVGQLPRCEGGSEEGVFQAGMTVAELRENRAVINRCVVNAVKELPFSHDVTPQVLDDAELGAMTQPRLLVPRDLESLTLTRRIPVRELRAKGWRTRVVDHETESGVNAATAPVDKIKHDTLDVLVALILRLFDAGIPVHMWKRDVSKAFRRVPVKAAHLEFAGAVWMDRGLLFVAQHKGMPFGTVSAVYAWHRVGHVLRTLVRRLFRAPSARYVDDFFGVGRVGVALSGGVVLSILASLVGFPTDPAKDSDFAETMLVLGALVRADFSERLVTTQVEPAKAAKYVGQLDAMLHSQTLSAGDASKLAGRLSFAVTVSGNRVGRAYIKPFFAQANAPLPGCAVSPWLHRAAVWFTNYLRQPPLTTRKGRACDRPCVVTWSDAAGASRWVAAVVHVGGRFWWSRLQTPDSVWSLLLDRGDHQIGFQELLGVLFVWETFKDKLKGALWLAFVDNDGVMHALTRGGGGGPESFACIGRLWLEVASFQTDLHCARVESASNVADGPTREEFEGVKQLKAEWVPPVIPGWVWNMWHGAETVPL